MLGRAVDDDVEFVAPTRRHQIVDDPAVVVEQKRIFGLHVLRGAEVARHQPFERRIGLSIKAANYSEEELKRESEAFDNFRPGEDMVGLEKAFEAATEDYRPGEGKKK